MKEFKTLQKPKKGDQVAVVSPSAGLPGLFPWVFELGLKRLQEDFELKPKEYPTTRQMGSSLEDRARDLMAAFADTDNMAVMAAIGGNDGIKLIRHLDPQVFLDNPKPFFGYSDSTHVHNFLWNLGIPSFYGGAIMTQFGMNAKMHDFTVDALNTALFETGEVELQVSKEFTDVNLDWTYEANLVKSRPMEPNDGLIWDGSNDAKGILWGGCVESMIVQSTTGMYLPSTEDLEGTILYLETAEDIPEPWIVEYLLTGFGERGWFDKFQAVLVGRPKGYEIFEKGKQNTPPEKAAYRQEQRKAVTRTVRSYNQNIPIIQNLDFGHTDPQVCLPSGGRCRIDTTAQKIFLTC